MAVQIDESMTLNEVVRRVPSAVAVFKRHADRYDGVKPRKTARIDAAIGSDGSPVLLPLDGIAWMDLTVGSTTLGCDDGSVCTIDACAPESGCTNTLANPGDIPECDDGDPCTDPACDLATGCRAPSG